MIGKLFALTAAAVGVMGQAPMAMAGPGGTEIVNVPQGATVIIIATNSGGGASWQNVNPPMAGTPPAPQTHQVTVGGDAGLTYTPSSINAAMGDYVQFNFMSQNHTVTQSTFNTPCVNAGMFDSNFVPNPNNTMNPPPAMKLQVNTTDPQWFYCKQKTPKPHCGSGMTFSINPTAAKTQDMFKNMAIQQNGTAGAAAPPASAAPPAASPAAPPPASPPAAAPPAGTSIASGMGTTDGSGACQCSCLCGVAQFPMANAQGMGNFGGMSGALPAANGVSPAPA